jgi:hypothetical protein
VAAASSGAGYIQRQAHRTEAAKRRRQPEQLTWASVRPPQTPVQGAVGKRPAESVPQAHQIHHRTAGIVDPYRMPGAASTLDKPSSNVSASNRKTVVGGTAILGGRLGLGTAIWTAAGNSSARSYTAAADTCQRS